MRVTSAFKRLLRLPGVEVTGVEFGVDRAVVTVALRRRRLVCPECPFSTASRYDTRPVESVWRHLDLGAWALEVRAVLRRLRCPAHGVRTEAVPFARPVEQSGFTRDFEHLVAWLATRMDKTAIERACRIAWRTVGRIIERVVREELDPSRLDGLFEIGVDEISWRRHHHYLTLVANHRSGKVVWGRPGRDTRTLDAFFNELGPQRAAEITAVSMDMGPAFAKSVRQEGHAPQAAICIDPFHVVALVTKALDEVRRDVWQQLRRLDDQSFARRFKGARWALLKRPENLTDRQSEALSVLRRKGGAVWRAYVLKEALREVFAGDLNADEATELLGRWCSRAQRCRLAPFVKAGRTIRGHLAGIGATLRLGVNNGRIEGLNNRVRLIVRRAFGFHSAEAALALVMLSCGPIELILPHER